MRIILTTGLTLLSGCAWAGNGGDGGYAANHGTRPSDHQTAQTTVTQPFNYTGDHDTSDPGLGGGEGNETLGSGEDSDPLTERWVYDMRRFARYAEQYAQLEVK